MTRSQFTSTRGNELLPRDCQHDYSPRVRIFASNFYDLSVRAFQFFKRVGAAYLGLAGPTSVLASKRLLVRSAPYFVPRRPWVDAVMIMRPPPFLTRYGTMARMALHLPVRLTSI